MAHPSASTCRQQRQRQQFGRLSAHRSSSQSVQVAQADLESRSDGDQTQLRLGSWTGAVTRPLQWRLPRGARTAVLLSALVAAVYAAADPALADTFHSQTAAGPFVPGPSRRLYIMLMPLTSSDAIVTALQSCQARHTHAYVAPNTMRHRFIVRTRWMRCWQAS